MAVLHSNHFLRGTWVEGLLQKRGQIACFQRRGHEDSAILDSSGLVLVLIPIFCAIKLDFLKTISLLASSLWGIFAEKALGGHMTHEKQNPDHNTPDPKEDASVTRRRFSKKAAYVAPAVLAVIAAAERPALAQSTPIFQ